MGTHACPSCKYANNGRRNVPCNSCFVWRGLGYKSQNYEKDHEKARREFIPNMLLFLGIMVVNFIVLSILFIFGTYR